jgi:hypothetical protein
MSDIFAAYTFLLLINDFEIERNYGSLQHYCYILVKDMKLLIRS